MSVFLQHRRKAFSAAYDTDAQAYIDAVGTLTTTEQDAVNDFVVSLKNDSIWSKFHAIYLMVGGTAAEHKWNLIDPRDLDAAYRLTFTGGSHDANGVDWNGTSEYADTKFQPETDGSSTDIHLSYYTDQDVGGVSTIEIGGIENDPGFDGFYIRVESTDNLAYGIVGNSGPSGTAPNPATGLVLLSVRSGSDAELYFNGSSIGTDTTWSGDLTNNNVFIGCSNEYGTAGSYSTRRCQFASIGTGLTDTEASNLNTAVDQFQTDLSR